MTKNKAPSEDGLVVGAIKKQKMVFTFCLQRSKLPTRWKNAATFLLQQIKRSNKLRIFHTHGHVKKFLLFTGIITDPLEQKLHRSKDE